MKTSLAALPLFCLPQVQSPRPAADPAPLDLAWLPAVERVEVQAPEGRLLRLRIQGEPGELVREVGLDALPAGAQVLEARVGSWYGSGVVVAIACAEDEATVYHYVGCRDVRSTASHAAASTDPGDVAGWRLSEPLFRSSGAPFRIVGVRDGASDALEISFRRGWIGSRAAPFEERAFVDPCPRIASLDPGQDRGLFAVTGLEPVR